MILDIRFWSVRLDVKLKLKLISIKEKQILTSWANKDILYDTAWSETSLRIHLLDEQRSYCWLNYIIQFVFSQPTTMGSRSTTGVSSMGFGDWSDGMDELVLISSLGFGDQESSEWFPENSLITNVSQPLLLIEPFHTCISLKGEGGIPSRPLWI